MRAEAVRVIEQAPWVKKLKESTNCDAFKWSQMSLKAAYLVRIGDPEAVAKYRCKSPGLWVFRALKTPEFPASSGTYCWMHLLYSGLHYNPQEQARLKRWFEKWREADEIKRR